MYVHMYMLTKGYYYYSKICLPKILVFTMPNKNNTSDVESKNHIGNKFRRYGGTMLQVYVTRLCEGRRYGEGLRK